MTNTNHMNFELGYQTSGMCPWQCPRFLLFFSVCNFIFIFIFQFRKKKLNNQLNTINFHSEVLPVYQAAIQTGA